MPHLRKVTAIAFSFTQYIYGKQFQSLLAIYVIGYCLGFVSTDTAVKTVPAGLAFIP